MEGLKAKNFRTRRADFQLGETPKPDAEERPRSLEQPPRA